MKITIYYGLSGSFKGTTISTLGLPTMQSAIKPWKHYQFGSFSGLVQDNDLTYGILHLVRLGEFLRGSWDEGIVERSISDCLFYNNNSDEFDEKKTLGEEKIQELVREEVKLLDGVEVKKVLLVQKDKEFIQDVILGEPTRKKTFHGDVDYYLDLQEKYVEWTLKYNTIDEVVEIENAKDYIENVLGLTYNPE